MASEAPEQVIALVVIMSVPEADHLNAALIVKGAHLIQALSETAWWHSNFHLKWKVAGNGLAAWFAFVTAGHSLSLLSSRCGLNFFMSDGCTTSPKHKHRERSITEDQVRCSADQK